jgi:NAD-dependent SIR2 family protein deacetylase
MECHGSYESAHCLKCRKAYVLKDIKEDILADHIPRCVCGGIIKPDVVFFGENLPEEFYRALDEPPEADLVLILGTSLNVQPAALFALKLISHVPSILVNLEETPYDDEMDVILHKDLDSFAVELMGLLE